MADDSNQEVISEDIVNEGEMHPQRISFSSGGMVATAHYRATEAGVRILDEGGNAVDAAVAAAFALGVCEAQASGLGGQTMMLIHLSQSRKNIAIDGSSRAPNRATPGLLRTRELRRGHRATTVPSTPAVLEYVRRTYGTLPLHHLLQPAIRLADEGYRLSELQNSLTQRALKHLSSNSAGAIFLRNGREPYPVGTVFRQPVLAETLRLLARKGIEDFYRGEIAGRIHEDMQDNNGLLHKDDLARIPWPIERRPIAGRYHDKRILTFPPPGAGRMLLEMLNILHHFPRQKWDIDTPRGAVMLAEVTRCAQLDRRDRPYDPNYYQQIEEERTIAPDYARRMVRRIRKHLKTGGETTHLSVMDRQGNVVSLTQSIERAFGACVVTPDLGFLYNNYMRAFEYEDISHPYYLRPNAVPWASVAPTIVFHGRLPWAALGSAGSERIAPSIAQVLLRLERSGPLEAVSAPRLHCSLEGTVHLEASRMRNDILQVLSKFGYSIKEREPFSFYLGCVQLVLHQRDGFIGVADIRRDGAAGGPSQ